jgi:hypothetical protein
MTPPLSTFNPDALKEINLFWSASLSNSYHSVTELVLSTAHIIGKITLTSFRLFIPITSLLNISALGAMFGKGPNPY